MQKDKRRRILQRLAISDNNSICFVVHKSSNFNCKLVSKIGKFMRSMSYSKKRKILDEGWMYKPPVQTLIKALRPWDRLSLDFKGPVRGACPYLLVAVDQGFPTWGTCNPGGTFAYTKGYI